MKLIKYIKNEYSLIVAFILICSNLNSQVNLVPNYSFEQTNYCPHKNFTPPPVPWYIPTNYGLNGGGGEYCNACDTIDKSASVPFNYAAGQSYQYARTGNAYILVDYRNGINRLYVQVKLFDSLKAGHSYYAEHFVNTPNSLGYACNNIGMLFTDSAIYADTINYYYPPILANPQVVNYSNPVVTDTLNWIKVSGVFTAKGGEQYLTLGNFKDNAHTAFVQFQPTGYGGAGYYIDDVSVYELDSFKLKADAGRDTTITVGDSAFIGSYTNGIDTIRWLQNGVTVIDSIRPGFWVYPTTNTYYVVTQTVNAYTSSDTVYVTVAPLPVIIDNYKLIIDNGIQKYSITNVWVTSTEINTAYFNVQRSTDGITFFNIGKVIAKGASGYKYIDNTNLTGVVYYRLEIVDKNGSKTYSEVKELSIINYQLSIAPNPAKDYITVIGSNIKQVIISDVSGRILLKSTEKKIDVRSLVSGTYIVQIETKSGNHVTEKLIKLP